jgi:signal transduction histidine kinase
MKSEFLSTAAHELRTPMSSVHGFAELLVSRDFDAETSRTIARTIHRQSSLLVQMVNELLDLARIEAGHGRDFHLEVKPLAPIVQETAAALLVAGDPRRVEFVPAEGDSQLVNVDGAKLRQALTNVLSNAYKYSRGQGAIRVSLPTRTGHGRPEVGIRVEDEGIGMTPEQVGRVFERFFRADPGGKVAGTGLGMTLVKEIAEAMKGSVEIESTLGQGTAVTIWLPSVGP